MRRSRGRTVPFVGRTEELATLRDAFEAADDGTFVVVLVGGEAGMGKTALTEAFTDELAAEGVDVHWGRCAEIGGAPAFWPWTQVMRSMGDDAVAAARERLDAHADEPFAVFDTVHEILWSRRRRTRVIVLDDLQAADLPSLELLRFLSRTAHDLPVLVIGTHRLSELRHDPARDVVLAGIARRARQLAPGALGAAEVRSLLADEVGPALADALTPQLLARSGGNALYVEQLVQAVGRGGPDVLAEIPDGIRAAVRARLQPLPDLTVELLSAASILGAPIHVGVLAAMAGREVEDVDDALAEAVAAGLLVERGSGLAFDHALVRDAVADQLPAAARRAWHAAAAQALAGRPGRPASAATVAQHLLDAADLVSAEEIGRWAEAAAGEARRVGAHGEVARWSEAAAGQWAVAGDLARQGAALKDAVRARLNGGDATGALASSDDLAALARESGSGVLLAQAALARAEVFQPAQELEAPPLLQEALAHPGLAAEPGLRTELLAATAALLGMPSAYGPRNDLDGARRAIAELTDLAASGDARARAHLADARLNVDSGPEHYLDRREWLAELDDALPPGPGVFERLNRVYWATSLAFEAGDLQEVERRLREWESLAERADSHYWRWRGAMARASLAYARGRLDMAEDLAVASHPLVASLNPDMGFRVLAGLVFTIRRDQGRLAELAGAGPGAFGVLGAMVAIEVGDLDEARRLLDQVAQLAEGTGPDDLYWLCLMSLLAYGSEAVGDADRCRAAAAALEPYGEQCVMWGRSYVFGSPVAETLGVAHRGAGDLVRSAAWFRRSTAWADGAGAHGFAVRGRVGLASVLPPGTERTTLLAEARRGAEALGMAHALAEVARLEGATTATPPIVAGPAVSAVTAIAPVTARARVRTLGRFEVVGAGTVEPARWSSRKARDALKMLIARRGRSIPREELIDLLWPDVDVSSGRNRLSVVLSMVRAALDPDKRLASDPLRADRQSVALDLNLVDVDLEAFLGSAAVGLAAAEDHLDDAAVRLIEAIDLVDRGPFLAEDPYVDWASATRSAVERTRRDVLRSMARVAEETDPEDAITWWARLVEVDPDDDAAVAALVGLLESAGRHGEVAEHHRAADQRRRALGLGGAD